MLPERARQVLMGRFHEGDRGVLEELEDDLIEILDSYGVPGAIQKGYTQDDIREILFSVVMTRTSILRQNAFQMQGCCDLTTEDIHSAVSMAIQKALTSFQPGMNRGNGSIKTVVDSHASVVNYIFNWAKKFIQNLLRDTSNALKIDEKGRTIGIKQYTKIPRYRKKRYNTVVMERQEIEIFKKEEKFYGKRIQNI